MRLPAEPVDAINPAEAGEPAGAGTAETAEAGIAEAGIAEAGPAGLGLAQRTDALESVVAGMVLYERVIIALRRLAQEDASARRFRPAAVD